MLRIPTNIKNESKGAKVSDQVEIEFLTDFLLNVCVCVCSDDGNDIIQKWNKKVIYSGTLVWINKRQVIFSSSFHFVSPIIIR